MAAGQLRRWQCFFCGVIYDEVLGWPEEGISAGTPWAEVPENWICPECGAAKTDFLMIELERSAG